MSNELDDVARSLFLGHIPNIWRKLAPDTLKTLGNWMVYFLRRFSQYTQWVSTGSSSAFSPHPAPSPQHLCCVGLPLPFCLVHVMILSEYVLAAVLLAHSF